MTLLQIALTGDSICQGYGGYDTPYGGKGCYAEIVFERLANISGIGPLIGPGFRGVWRNEVLATWCGTEWGRAGSWTKTASTDAFDKNWGGYAYYSSGGSGTTQTWTRPSYWRRINGGVCVEYIDTGGNWQYAINGGTWTNHGQTIANNNAYKRFYIAGTGIETVAFRAYDGASATAICLCGVEPYYATPQGASGLIGHNLGLSGIDLHDIALSTSGDRMAGLDAVTLGTGSPISRRPSLVVIGPYSNDVPDINNATTFGTDLTTFRTRVTSYATVGFINVYEQGSARNTTTQASYRSTLKSTAAGFSASVLDWYDQWTALGVGTYLTSRDPAALLDVGSIHPSQAGYLDLADRVYPFVKQLLAINGGTPSTYPFTGRAASAAGYAGAKASVAYAGGLPIRIG